MTTHTKAGTYIELIKPLGCGEWLCEAVTKHGRYICHVKESDMRETPKVTPPPISNVESTAALYEAAISG